MGDQSPPRRTLGDFGRSTNLQILSVAYTLDEANAFEIRTSLLNALKQNQFTGAEIEDPHQHLVNFYEICGTLKLDGITEDAKKLRLFPFTITDRAKDWLHNLPGGSIISWRT